MRNDKSLFGKRFLLRAVSVCAVWAMLAVPAFGQDGEGQDVVGMTDYGTFDLQVQDTDLGKVLQMLSLESKQNIVTSMNVSGTVTANLYDVTLEEALTAILTPNGYTFIPEGKFIYVFTQEEARQIEEERRQVETRIFELDYISPIDASDAIANTLSERGTSTYLGDVTPGIDPDTGDVGANSWAFAGKLVVTDFPEYLDRVAAILEDLDIPPSQVMVEATVLSAQLDEATALGVSFSVLGSVDFSDLISPLGPVTEMLNGGLTETSVMDNEARAVQSTVGNVASSGGLKVGILSDSIAAFVRVLDDVTTTSVLARPKVMSLNNQRAEILVGARIGYLSSTATETSTTQTVEFLDTGIHLVYRPFINKDGSIRLELAPSVSEASLRTVTDSGGAQVTIPDELTNELTTNIRVQDGETLVLGGLFRESIRTGRSQIPYLGDIPVLGLPFRGQDDAVDRSEIIFLITPTVVPDQVAWDLGDDMLEHTEQIRVGARKGLLCFSNDTLTDGYNQDAIAAYNRGNMREAEWYANTSLRLQPQQPEMREFRDQLLGTTNRHYERSTLERAFRSSFGDSHYALFKVEPVQIAPDTATAEAEANAADPAENSMVDNSDNSVSDEEFDWLEEMTSESSNIDEAVDTADAEEFDAEPAEVVTSVDENSQVKADDAMWQEHDFESFESDSFDNQQNVAETTGFEVFADKHDTEQSLGLADFFGSEHPESAKATINELSPGFSEVNVTAGHHGHLSFAIGQMLKYFSATTEAHDTSVEPSYEVVEAPEYTDE